MMGKVRRQLSPRRLPPNAVDSNLPVAWNTRQALETAALAKGWDDELYFKNFKSSVFCASQLSAFKDAVDAGCGKHRKTGSGSKRLLM